MKNKTNLRDATVAGALLLATSPVLAGGTKTGQPTPPNVQSGGGKCQPGIFQIDSITVDKKRQGTVKICPVSKKTFKQLEKPRPRKKNIISLAFPQKQQPFTLQFDTSCLPISEDGYVLVLLYSRCLSKRPQINTPDSRKKLRLNKKDTQVLGIYNVPAIQKKSGNASEAESKMSIEVNLNTKLLAKQVKSGNDTFYIQGALLKKADYDQKKYSGAVLSPLEAIHVTPGSCPSEKQFVDDFNSPNKACKKLRGKN